MQISTVQEAPTQFSNLVIAAINGTEILIAQDGKPVAKLIPFRQKKRRFGVLKRKVIIAKDFDAPLVEEFD